MRAKRPSYSLLWAALIIPLSIVVSLRGSMTPWAFMWLLAVSIFAALKWWTWRQAMDHGAKPAAFRSMAFLFLWPGMDAARFLESNHGVPKPGIGDWLFALGKTALGATLIWGVARLAGNGWGAGWIAMIGLIFFLHFGLFHLLSLFWQQNGIDAQPLMRWPALATSVGDFWGRRWNAGFRDVAFGLLFLRLSRHASPRIATFATFLISGLLHELVITFPAGAGYGLPTLYFLIQGAGIAFERSRFAARFRLRRTLRGRLFAIAVATLPICALFPEPFVLRVMVPFFQFLKALP